MEKLLRRISTLGLVLALGTGMTACSLSQTSETGEELGDELPVASAETDAVPLDSAESLEGEFPESMDTSAEQLPPADAPSTFAEAPPAFTEAPPVDPMLDPAASAPPVYAEATPPEPAALPADPVPAAEEPAAPVSESSTGEHEDYTVQGGDTLMKIAFEVYGDIYKWKKILEDNQDKISNPNNIPRGTVLKVEKSTAGVDRNGEKYLIKSGDTLGTISNDVYGTTSKWKKLWENNKQLIKDPNRIFAGFYLYYTMSAEDQQELDQHRSTSTPLADESEAPRNPAAEAPIAEAQAVEAPAVQESVVEAPAAQ